jgi:hypothetical protein
VCLVLRRGRRDDHSVRIGDRERRRTEQRLRASYLRGELSADTFEGRVGAVYAATHARQLAPLAADLPGITERVRMTLGRRPRPDGPTLVAPHADPGACLRLGRSRTCDVRFVEHSVSRDHAELRRTTSGWVLVDRASSNGTYVNGVRVRRALVGDGDEIRLGAAKVVFRA